MCMYLFISIFFISLVPPNILDTESTQSTIAIRENQNISLTCKANGFPTPKIMWRREDGQPILVERRKKGKLSSMLRIIVLVCSLCPGNCFSILSF